MLVKDGYVDQPLSEYLLGCSLDRGEIRLAVLLCIGEDRIDDVVAVTHLDGFEEPFMFAHVLEYIGLQVAICDENGAPGDIFEGLLEGLNHLLHSLVGCLAVQDLKYVLIYHLDFLDVDFLTARAQGTK